MRHLVALTFLLFLVCGCSREVPEKDTPLAKVYERLSEVPEDAIVLDVGGNRISKRDYADYLEMMVDLYRNRHPSANKEKLNSARVRMRMSAVNELVSRISLLKYLCGTNVVEASAATRREFEKNYLKTFARKSQNFDDLKDAMYATGRGESFLRAFENDLKIRVALQSGYSNELAVTEEDLRHAKERTAKYNARAAATNDLILSNIAIVTNGLAKGENFAKLADQYSMGDDKPGGEMGICDLDDFAAESESYRKAVSDLEPGRVTGVLETATTYEILKAEPVLEKDEDGDRVWNLRRIQFQKPYFIEAMDDAALSDLIAKNKRDTLLQRLAPEIRKACKVSFPSGKKIFDLDGKKKPGFLKKNKEVGNE